MFATATVLGYQPTGAEPRIAVQFDTGSTAQVPLDALWRCELRQGDEVRLPGKRGGKYTRTGNVSTVSSWVHHNTVTVQIGSQTVLVPARDLGISKQVVGRDWQDRRVASFAGVGIRRTE